VCSMQQIYFKSLVFADNGQWDMPVELFAAVFMLNSCIKHFNASLSKHRNARSLSKHLQLLSSAENEKLTLLLFQQVAARYQSDGDCYVGICCSSGLQTILPILSK